ncbi:fimbrial protein [Alloalcanivorax xenomutans]|uniref:fimbrial protein n=1 Tax=Alloalcanivorax xenomutans TaxID=1094342 RepID=UPI00230947A4|nr:type 1 fimbrial protein [Alloalcanivorax xenomutans]
MNKKWIKSITVVLFTVLLPTITWARCTVNDGVIAQNIDMNMGQVTITPDAQVGDVLAMREFNINGTDTIVRCDWAGGWIYGRVLQGQPSALAPDIYTTNVEGIGIRLARRRQGSGLNDIVTYPHDQRGNSNTNYTLAEGFFRVEIIKTAAQTGSGVLTSGLYSSYYTDGSGSSQPVLTSQLYGSGITIVSSACEVDMGSRNIAVDFGTVSRSVFAGVGSTNTEREFQVGLSCVGPSHGQDTVKLSFGYTPDPDGAAGVIKIDEGSEAASGVGIQLLDNRTSTPIANGDRVELGTVTPGDHQFQLPLKARYYQTAPTVNGGETRAIATFTIEYN